MNVERTVPAHPRPEQPAAVVGMDPGCSRFASSVQARFEPGEGAGGGRTADLPEFASIRIQLMLGLKVAAMRPNGWTTNSSRATP